MKQLNEIHNVAFNLYVYELQLRYYKEVSYTLLSRKELSRSSPNPESAASLRVSSRISFDFSIVVSFTSW